VRRIDPGNFQRATRATPREINHQIVLNLVREYQPISRADLARRMEVAPGIMSRWVRQLIEHGLLYEEDTGTALRGRKPSCPSPSTTRCACSGAAALVVAPTFAAPSFA
jgi:transposase-like protein